MGLVSIAAPHAIFAPPNENSARTKALIRNDAPFNLKYPLPAPLARAGKFAPAGQMANALRSHYA
jgi:hypothetical protein